MKTNQILLLAGAGALAYYFFVHKKSESSSEFSNVGSCYPPKFWCDPLNACVTSQRKCNRAVRKYQR